MMTSDDHDRYEALEKYSLAHNLGIAEVAIMVRYKILEVQHELSGQRVVPADDLSHEEALSSWRALWRVESLHLYDDVSVLDQPPETI